MTTVASPTKNSPSNQVVPNRQVNTAHALAQYLTNKKIMHLAITGLRTDKGNMAITTANRITQYNIIHLLVQYVSMNKKMMHVVLTIPDHNRQSNYLSFV